MSTTTAVSGQNRWTNLPAANLDDQGRGRVCLAQQPKDGAGEVALERAECFQAALTGSLFALQVGACSWLAAPLDDRDRMQRRVELSVAVAVEAMAALLTGGRVDRRDTGEPRELRITLEASGASGLADDLACNQSAATLEGKQLWRRAGDAECDLALELVDITG
jgi:hypothetical protein